MVEAAARYVDPKQYSITTSNTYAELVCITKDAMYTYVILSLQWTTQEFVPSFVLLHCSLPMEGLLHLVIEQ